METIRAVFFDFGGTLFTYELLVATNTSSAIRLARLVGADADHAMDAYRTGMARAGREFSDKSYYLHRDMFAAGVRYAVQTLGRELDERSVHDFVSWLNSTITDSIVPRDGLYDVLAELRLRNIHIGGASNADIEQFEPMVEALQVRPLFDSLMCSEHAGACKPDAKFFYHALNQAGCEASEAIYVGDTPSVDIEGSEGVGMRAVLIEENSNIVFDRGSSREDQIMIKELRELVTYLDQLSGYGPGIWPT
jgi:HAD superfamily hydrolase (TIGR01509 family)